MLCFTAKTEEEVMNEHLMAAGDYKMRVVEAKFGHSQAGNPQINLKLLHAETDHAVYCNLTTKFLKLLKHFCDSAKLEYKYQQGTLEAHDCLDKDVIVRVGIKPKYKEENKNVNYVDDFLKEMVIIPMVETAPAFDDAIPF